MGVIIFIITPFFEEFMNVNLLVYESLDSMIQTQLRGVKNNPIGYASVLAALYTLYVNSKNKEDKIESIINSLPKAAKIGLATFLASHSIKSLASGNIDLRAQPKSEPQSPPNNHNSNNLNNRNSSNNGVNSNNRRSNNFQRPNNQSRDNNFHQQNNTAKLIQAVINDLAANKK